MRSKLFLLLMAFCFIQCDDFLEEQSENEIRPATVSDMEKILETTAYPTLSGGLMLNRKTEIFTDNVQSNIVNDGSMKVLKEKDIWRFRWDVQMFNEGGGGQDITFWTLPYEQVKGCNLVLEYIDGMDGNEMKKQHMKGEVYVLRGVYYFTLVNFFALPYNYGDPKKNPGVPLKLITGVTDEKFKRNTVAECYEQILKDMGTGIELMKANQEKQSNNILRLRYLAGYGLLSRVYLHMNEWDKVIHYADSVLNEYSSLLDFKSSYSPYGCGSYHPNTPTEILWGVGEAESQTEWDVLAAYGISDDLVDLYMYDANEGAIDQRKSGSLNWFKTSWMDGTYRVVMKGKAAQYWINGGIRTAEVYLNRAEAYIRKYVQSGNEGEAQAALNDLNQLRRNRFDNKYVDKTMADFANAEELLGFCLRERRRELCYESNHRWFDLRRTGMPELKHVFVDNDNGYRTEYVLQKEDPRYVLPIPDEVTKRNPNLKDDGSVGVN